ncbi:MAG TPA: cytochrome C oxidase subunit IV family protein [Candidatus Acidoferrum sp.]|nr:cytochrome C oxidase subunit IV family protein [Candidatus Acidoferrum sp.]
MAEHSEHSEHIVSPWLYGGIFSALIVGTILTTWAAFQDFGPFNIVIALAIATAKATLVVLFFMHARYSPKRTQLVIVCAIFWLAIMLTLTLSDYQTRQPRASRSVAPTAIYNA